MLTKEQGIQAIIDLQAKVGIEESREQAEISWEGFQNWEKKQTEHAHSVVCGGFKDNNE